MRLQILSDLHIDVVGGFAPALVAGVDAVVVAGDVCEGAAEGMAFLRQHIREPVPILMALGNHEFYGRHVHDERLAAADAARRHGVMLLDDGAAEIAGVRFVGGTLWTDFSLHGPAQQASAMAMAQHFMNDYRCIGLDAGRRLPFTPEASVEQHRRSREYLENALAQAFPGPTVVVTHHAPHPGSIHTRFADDPVNPAFISDLSDVIERGRPRLWVHGHVHNSFDYRVSGTRVVCNPRGYGRENPAFDPGLVIEV